MRRTALARAAAVLAGAGILGFAASRVRAGAPILTGISPSHGPSDQPTSITLSGDGFEPGARIALLNGGPFLLGSYIMPEGARAVEIKGDRACVAFYSHATKLGGILILDLSDPAAPVPVGGFETGDSGTGVQVAGSPTSTTWRPLTPSATKAWRPAIATDVAASEVGVCPRRVG